MLREAASQGDTEYLTELLKGGANPCSSDENGLCAVHLAAWNGHVAAPALFEHVRGFISPAIGTGSGKRRVGRSVSGPPPRSEKLRHFVDL